jgi:hypothetical protein
MKKRKIMEKTYKIKIVQILASIQVEWEKLSPIRIDRYIINKYSYTDMELQ